MINVGNTAGSQQSRYKCSTSTFVIQLHPSVTSIRRGNNISPCCLALTKSIQLLSYSSMTGCTEGGASLNQTLPIEHPNRFGGDDSDLDKETSHSPDYSSTKKAYLWLLITTSQ